MRLEQHENAHKQLLGIYQLLEALGFGLKELKRLRFTVEEIRKANDIPPSLALTKFFKDIEEQYDNKLGFESKLNELELKIQELSFEEANLRTHLSTLPVVASSLSSLLQKGLSEQDIVSIDKLLRIDARDGKKLAITIEELNSLIRELRQNGKTKLVFSESSHQLSHSKKELSLLQRQNSELYTKIQNMLYSGLYLAEILEHFRRYFFTSIENGL